MKYLKNRSNLIIEKLIQADKAGEKILEKDTIIFHGTVESFDPEKLGTGSYDKVLWTALDSSIAQTYIPVSGGTTHVNTTSYNSLRQNLGSDKPTEYTNMFGLTWTDIDYDEYGRPTSHRSPIEFKEINDAHYNLQQEDYVNYKALKDFKAEMSKYLKDNTGDLDEKHLTELIEKESELERKSKISTEKMREKLSTKQKNEYINKLIRAKGYEPTMKNDEFGDYSWKLKTKYRNGKSILLPANFREKGKLFIMKPMRDFKILDLRRSEEGDLSDVEYHNTEGFRAAEKAGYDGIYINDFAQIESEGNSGHTSIGVFNSSIKDLDVEVLADVEHPDKSEIERMYKTKDWSSKEYLKHKQGL